MVITPKDHSSLSLIRPPSSVFHAYSLTPITTHVIMRSNRHRCKQLSAEYQPFKEQTFNSIHVAAYYGYYATPPHFISQDGAQAERPLPCRVQNILRVW